MDFHFISGLPRSGSTLLASILRQNPNFIASIMTPLGRVFSETHQAMGPGNEADGFFTDHQRARMLCGLVESYYDREYIDTGPRGAEVCAFDNNRRWTANASLLGNLFPACRIICCVRAPAAIVDSFERLFQANPLTLSVIFGGQSNFTPYERAAEVMKNTGVLGWSLAAFRGAYYGPERGRLLVIDYDDLARYPGDIMKSIHQQLSLPAFEYNFKKIAPIPGAAEFDRAVSTPGLHDLKPEVVYETRQSVLPPDIWSNLPPPFWRTKDTLTPVG